MDDALSDHLYVACHALLKFVRKLKPYIETALLADPEDYELTIEAYTASSGKVVADLKSEVERLRFDAPQAEPQNRRNV